MKDSPFISLKQFTRVIIKALLIALLINFGLLALAINPIRALVQANTWDLLGRGRERLAYPGDFQNGQLPIEALLETHTISRPKAPDEYRVILLGESGIAGWGVPDEETLSAQLTARQIEIGGKRMVFYNLAYPKPSIARDLLILDAAGKYDPDMVIWFMSPITLNNEADPIEMNGVFFNLNRNRLERLAGEYDDLIGEWYDHQGQQLLTEEPAWEQYSAIRDQELLPIWLNRLIYPFEPPALGESDRRIGLEEAPDKAIFDTDHPGYTEMPNESWAFLRAGCEWTAAHGVRLLVVNEAMAINTTGYADSNYNMLYSRALYDAYREALADYAADYGLWYADLWDTVPAEYFTDTPLHADGEGYAILSGHLENLINSQPDEDSTCR